MNPEINRIGLTEVNPLTQKPLNASVRNNHSTDAFAFPSRQCLNGASEKNVLQQNID